MTKTLLTDLRVGLSALLAAQGAILDLAANIPGGVKVGSSVLALAGIVLGVVTAVQDAQTPIVPPPPPLPKP
jgi:hypothetical protein